MAIRRARREENYTILHNQTIRDKRLSYKARGLLMYMLSMKDDWVFYIEELSKHSQKDGTTSIKTALKELETCGYLVREQRRSKDGKFSASDWVVLDISTIPPQVENPLTGFPLSDNQPLRITNNNNNQIKNNNKRDSRQSKINDMTFLLTQNNSQDSLKESIADYLNTFENKHSIQKLLKFAEEYNPDMVATALIKGAKKNNQTLKYPIAIMNNWVELEIETVEDIKEAEALYFSPYED